MRTFLYIIPVVTIFAMVALHVGTTTENSFIESNNNSLEETKSIYAAINAKHFQKTGKVWSKSIPLNRVTPCSIPSF